MQDIGPSDLHGMADFASERFFRFSRCSNSGSTALSPFDHDKYPVFHPKNLYILLMSSMQWKIPSSIPADGTETLRAVP